MKLIIAILDQADVQNVSLELEKQGYFSTVSDAKGSFLKADKAVMFIGVNSVNMDSVLEIIGEYSHSREKQVPEAGSEGSRPSTVQVGGALVLVMNVEQFEKL